MREIKFRGKSAITGNWVYGYYYKAKYYVNKPVLHSFITTPRPKEHNKPSVITMVIPETVGQYTGLKDKNGVEIYEGDILETEDQVSEVVFGRIGYDCKKNGITGFGLKDNYYYSDREKEGFIELYYRNDFDTCKVIGNIHEEVEK